MHRLLRILLLLTALATALKVEADWRRLMDHVFAKGIMVWELQPDASFFVQIAQGQSAVIELSVIAVFLVPAAVIIFWSQWQERRHARREPMPMVVCLLYILAAGFLIDGAVRVGSLDTLSAESAEPRFAGLVGMVIVQVCILGEIWVRLTPKKR